MNEYEKADGFFWSERDAHRYCVVVLSRTQYEYVTVERGARRSRIKRLVCREYHAHRVADLRRQARRDGFLLGRNVRRNCLDKPHWRGCTL